jgi:hypothetical protein
VEIPDELRRVAWDDFNEFLRREYPHNTGLLSSNFVIAMFGAYLEGRLAGKSKGK